MIDFQNKNTRSLLLKDVKLFCKIKNISIYLTWDLE